MRQFFVGLGAELDFRWTMFRFHLWWTKVRLQDVLRARKGD